MTRARDVATQGGLVLITTGTFSSAAFINVTNCFSSAYTNYKIIFRTTQASSANRDITFQLLSDTTPATSSYYQGMSLVGSTGGNSWQAVNNGGGIISCAIWDTVGDLGAFDMTVFKPFLTLRTNFTLNNSQTSAGNYYYAAGGGAHSSVTSYNGFRLSVPDTTFGGIVKVYGIKD